MNRILFNIYRVVVPKPLRTSILKHNLKKNLLHYYSVLHPESVDEEKLELLEYLKSNPVSIFPYQFSMKYAPGFIEVFSDQKRRMRYVMLDGKKLYFRKQWAAKRIRRAFADLSREQDPLSPHRYLVDEFDVNQNDVIADIGAAEGNFSLSVADRVKKIYLFESDSRWVDALEATFEPYSDKTVIIRKRVSDVDDEQNVRMDTFINSFDDITFLKIDVDGAERQVLEGCRGILSGRRPLKIALCTYHKEDDAKEFSELLKGYGFKVTFSKGYMIPYYDKKLKAPWLRRGLIRAERH